MDISKINDAFKALEGQILSALQECSDRINNLEQQAQKESNKKMQIARILLGDDYDR